MPDYRTKELIYKRAEFAAKTGKTLQQHLNAAWDTLKFAGPRQQKLGHDGEDVRLWNRKVKRGLLTCGMFHSWEHGRSQLVISVTENVSEYQIVATEPPKKAGVKESEYNEGLLFFGVHNNHVLIVQSASLRVSALNDYLNWLLQDATSEMAKENRLELMDQTPKQIGGTSRALKSIILSPSVPAGIDEAAAEVPLKAHGKRPPTKEVKIKLGGSQWGWLRDVLRGMKATVPDDLEFGDEFNADRLQIEIELKWKGRDKDRVETPLLDTVMRAFQDVDHPPIRAVTATGDRIEGHELRLKKFESFEVDGRIPVAGDVFEKMQKYLTELLARGDITPD
jgi:hypothetical protein